MRDASGNTAKGFAIGVYQHPLRSFRLLSDSTTCTFQISFLFYWPIVFTSTNVSPMRGGQTSRTFSLLDSAVARFAKAWQLPPLKLSLRNHHLNEYQFAHHSV